MKLEKHGDGHDLINNKLQLSMNRDDSCDIVATISIFIIMSQI